MTIGNWAGRAFSDEKNSLTFFKIKNIEVAKETFPRQCSQRFNNALIHGSRKLGKDILKYKNKPPYFLVPVVFLFLS
jgi:hypothetical protein